MGRIMIVAAGLIVLVGAPVVLIGGFVVGLVAR